MKQYQFSLKDECMKELPSRIKILSVPEGVDYLKTLQSIPVPKGYLNQFIDEKIYDEVEINWRMKYPEQKNR